MPFIVSSVLVQTRLKRIMLQLLPARRNPRRKRRITHNGLRCYRHWKAIIRTLTQSRSKIATVSTARYGNTRGSDRYSFDPATGEITEVQLYKDLPKSGKIRGWIYSVHVGSWGGMTTRILTCLVSLLGTIFAITGYYFWIKKQFRKLRWKERGMFDPHTSS